MKEITSSFFLYFIFLVNTLIASDKHEVRFDDTLKRDTLLKFSSNPEKGFNFEYFIYLPKGYILKKENHLLVETNNTGLNDTMSVHLMYTINQVRYNSVANYVSRKLKLPLLMPVFPRSMTNWEVYTHALDRETLLCKDGGIRRIDLQLIAMTDDAKQQLKEHHIKLKNKIFITGFSASGSFANRFSLLHPELVEATASGGINAMAILPFNEINGHKLNFPLGVADLKDITGKEANIKAFAEIPKMLYMGELDDNDAVAFDDAYSLEDRTLVHTYMGIKLTPERWKFMEESYKKNNINSEFITYPGIGHGTDKRIKEDLVDFFRKYSE